MKRMMALRLAGCALAAMGSAGCTTLKQEQYFAATDTDTGVTNYYKMTIEGSSGLLANYRMQAGYFSAAAVDVLRGTMPKVPELDLPVEQLEVFERVNTHFSAALIQEAKRIQPVDDPEALRIAATSTRNVSNEQLGRVSIDLKEAQAKLADVNASFESATKAADAASADRDKAVAHFNTAVIDANKAALDLVLGRRKRDDAQRQKDSALRGVATARQVASDAATDAKKAGEAKRTADAAYTDAKTKADAAPDDTALRAALAQATESKDHATTKLDHATQAATDATTRLKAAESDLQTATDLVSNSESPLPALSEADTKARAALEASRGPAIVARQRATDSAAKLVSARTDQVRASRDVDSLAVREQRLTASRDVAEQTLAQLGSVVEAPGRVPSGTEEFTEERAVAMLRQMWLTTLSASDRASAGMIKNLDPYQFRKLVFWASVTPMDLNQFSSEVDGVISNSIDMADAVRKQAAQRKQEKLDQEARVRKAARRAAASGDSGVVDDLLEEAPAESTPPTGGSR